MKLPTTIKANILTRTTTEFFAENTALNSVKPPEKVMTCHNYMDGSFRRVNKFDDGSRCIEEFDANGKPALVCATDKSGVVAKLTQLDENGHYHTGNKFPSFLDGDEKEYHRHGMLFNLNGYAKLNAGYSGYFINGVWYRTDAEYVKGIRAWLVEHPEDSSQFLVDWDKKETEYFANPLQAMVDRVPVFRQTEAVKDIADMFLEAFCGGKNVAVDCVHDSITVTIGDKSYGLKEKN